jgi:hypothetical protein
LRPTSSQLLFGAPPSTSTRWPADSLPTTLPLVDGPERRLAVERAV